MTRLPPERRFGSSRSRLVGVIVPTVANLMFADKIESLAQAFQPHDYQLVVAHNAYSLERETGIVETLAPSPGPGAAAAGLKIDPRTNYLFVSAITFGARVYDAATGALVAAEQVYIGPSTPTRESSSWRGGP
jgi:hypothetical protein